MPAVREAVGVVEALSRFPVKAMRGERLEQADVTELGLIGDRAYALRDLETGEVVNAKHARVGSSMMSCRAAFVEQPRPGGELPPVRITLPDDTWVRSDSADADARLSAFFGHPVTLERAAPDATIDQYRGVLERLRADLLAEAGLPAKVRLGAFFDLMHVSVLTTSTLDRCTELRPETRFEARRFRMNVILRTPAAGFVENEWPGRELRIGDSLQLRVGIAVPRCRVTTMPQDELPKDPHVLKTLARHNRLRLAGTDYPCAGVYASVEAAGSLRAGDSACLS